MNKSVNNIISGLAIVSLAAIAGSASALTSRTVTGVGSSIEWLDTSVTPSGSWLRGKIESYGVGTAPWYSETGGRLTTTIPVSSPNPGTHKDTLTIWCGGNIQNPVSNTWSGSRSFNQVCGAFSVVSQAKGEIDDL